MKARTLMTLFHLQLLVTGSFALAPAAQGYYDPSLARWINRDPIGEPGFRSRFAADLLGALRRTTSMQFDRENSQRHDLLTKPLYTYVNNDPVAHFDPKGLDRPGCDGIPGASETPCALEACAKHDKCYRDNGCNAWSWLEVWEPVITACKRCNCTVLAEFIGCGIWDEGFDDETTPNYYCGLHDVFFDDPSDPHMSHSW